jgi:hypothetical protein
MDRELDKMHEQERREMLIQAVKSVDPDLPARNKWELIAQVANQKAKLVEKNAKLKHAREWHEEYLGMQQGYWHGVGGGFAEDLLSSGLQEGDYVVAHHKKKKEWLKAQIVKAHKGDVYDVR